jgi:hypothetical protein
MVKLVDKQTSFNFGIITEKLRARDDLKQYPSGVADALNFYASKYGPISKRVGTLYKWNSGNVGKKVNLIPFVLSLRQSLVLEFLDNKIRFYTFDGENFGPIADPTDATKQYEIVSPYTADEIETLSYAQSLNVMYIADPSGNHRPRELRRFANNNWQFVDYTFEDGPYQDQNYDQTKKVKVSTTNVGSATLTVTGFNLTRLDVGRHVRINHPEESTLEDRWGWGVITAVTDSTHATINMKQKAWATTDTTDFRLGAWYGTNWPSLVTIHEQRVVWQGTTDYPWLWMTNSFNYHNFSPSDYSGNVKDSNAIYYNMATDKIAPVRWMASLGSLLIGTELYEMRMYSAGAGLAPGDCVVRKESTYGVHDALPVITDDTLIFIQRLQRTLRSVAYDYTRDAYVGPELSVLSESLTIPGMKKIVYQREPNAIIWTLLEDGTLLAVTYDKEQDVTAWTRVEIAGDNAKVVDIVSVPSATFKQDMLILLVERKINGTTRRYMEILSKEYSKKTPIKDIPFLDSAMRYSGPAITQITGLGHLEGQTVRVLDEGALHEDVTVSNGAVELQYPIKDGWIGLPYKAYFETLERDFGDRQISVKMGRVRIHRLMLYLLRTLGLTVKQQSRGLTTQLLTFSPISNMDTAPEPVSGQEEHDIMTAWTNFDMSYTLIFESEPGMPCTVGGIFAGVEINAL